MTNTEWEALYKTVVDGKIRIVGGHLVVRQDAATVLALYDSPEVTPVQRRNLREHTFDEVLGVARQWLGERELSVVVDPEGFSLGGA
ncbi:MAG TPA: hypothetical protein VMS77_09375 [Conexivisphaerales archaeon]|nr:hypothetical protein [Conexivisphaerales archaeon]